MTDLIFEQHRADALKRACDYCQAEAGELCFNLLTGHVLEHQPAHHVRLRLGPRRLPTEESR